MKMLEELSKHGETEGQAKLHRWSMIRRTKEKRQAAQADMARLLVRHASMCHISIGCVRCVSVCECVCVRGGRSQILG